MIEEPILMAQAEYFQRVCPQCAFAAHFGLAFPPYSMGSSLNASAAFSNFV